MKKGDNVNVTIEGQVVCQATVESVDEGTVTLVVPATRVVMATTTNIVEDKKEEADSTILGVDAPVEEDA